MTETFFFLLCVCVCVHVYSISCSTQHDVLYIVDQELKLQGKGQSYDTIHSGMGLTYQISLFHPAEEFILDIVWICRVTGYMLDYNQM